LCCGVQIANILLPPLLALEERLALAVRPNGKVCLSGVLVEQASKVIEAYSRHFDNLTVESDNDGMWACIHGTRRA
jgi:ribosomal protein L11 methyltransferase